MHLQGVESRASQAAWDVPLREDDYTGDKYGASLLWYTSCTMKDSLVKYRMPQTIDTRLRDEMPLELYHTNRKKKRKRDVPQAASASPTGCGTSLVYVDQAGGTSLTSVAPNP
jgi:hypothetical protein